MTSDVLWLGLAWLVSFLFSTTLHEAGHALAALRLGDETAYEGGQVSLNPLPHIQREPIGMLVIPVLSFVMTGYSWMIGWASAPYDPRWAWRYPKRAGLMALAGPSANLLLALGSGALLRAGLVSGWFEVPRSFSRSALAVADGGFAAGAATLLSVLFSLNLILLVFNLLPLPPMDGSSVVQIFLPEAASRRLQTLFRQPMLGYLGLFVAWQLFPRLFAPIDAWALGLLWAR